MRQISGIFLHAKVAHRPLGGHYSGISSLISPARTNRLSLCSGSALVKGHRGRRSGDGRLGGGLSLLISQDGNDSLRGGKKKGEK